jgi:hypothetical protein
MLVIWCLGGHSIAMMRLAVHRSFAVGSKALATVTTILTHIVLEISGLVIWMVVASISCTVSRLCVSLRVHVLRLGRILTGRIWGVLATILGLAVARWARGRLRSGKGRIGRVGSEGTARSLLILPSLLVALLSISIVVVLVCSPLVGGIV